MRLSIHLDHILTAAKESGDTLADTLAAVKARGFSSVDVNEDTEDADIEAAKAAGFTVAAMHGFYHLGYRESDLARAEAALLRAASVGAEYFVTVPGVLLNKQDTVAYERMCAAVEALAKKGMTVGITVLLEGVAHEGAPYASSVGAVAFLEKAPSARLSFHTAAFLYAGEEAILAYRETKEKIARVTLRDGLREERTYGEAALTTREGISYFPAPALKGDLHLKELLNAMQKDGYTGDVLCEHYGANESLCIDAEAEALKPFIKE